MKTILHICINPIPLGLLFNLKPVQQHAQLCKMCNNIRPHNDRNMTHYLTVHWKKSFISAFKMFIYTIFQQASRTVKNVFTDTVNSITYWAQNDIQN